MSQNQRYSSTNEAFLLRLSGGVFPVHSLQQQYIQQPQRSPYHRSIISLRAHEHSTINVQHLAGHEGSFLGRQKNVGRPTFTWLQKMY